jgi:MinD-like ATPase involved in chromosome partitioning or flagellar assembly
MSSGKKICTLVCNNKGGVGKSIVSMFKALVFEKAGYPLQVIEIDHQRRLSSLVGKDGVHKSIPANVNIEDIARDKHAAEKFYNAVYREWMRSDSLTDLGANVTTPLLSWIERSKIMLLAAEDEITFRLVAVASPDDEALRGAVSAIKEARKVLGAGSEYFVVLNDIYGSYGFAPYETNDAYRELLEMEAAGFVGLIRMQFCDSILFEVGRALNINPRAAMDRADEIAAASTPPLDEVTTRIEKSKLREWLRGTQEALMPILTKTAKAAA